MMDHLTILNSKQIKEIHSKLLNQFGFNKKLDYAFLKSNKGNIYIVTSEISKIDLDSLRIESMGIYFAEEQKNGELRLSIEGSQIIGKHAKKNVFTLDKKQLTLWFKGYDLEIEQDKHGFQLIKNNNDFFGCGRFVKDELKNYMPKTRRILNQA